MPHPVRKNPCGTYGNHLLTNANGGCRRGRPRKRGGHCCPPRSVASVRRLAFDDVDDLVRLRTDDDVPAVHQDHVIAAPFRIDLDDPGRQRMEANDAGTAVPTEMLKLTLVVSWIFSDLMAETIWVRFSAGGAAVAEVAALPVVVCDLLVGRALGSRRSCCRSWCRGPRPSCPCRPWCRVRSSCSSTSHPGFEL